MQASLDDETFERRPFEMRSAARIRREWATEFAMRVTFTSRNQNGKLPPVQTWPAERLAKKFANRVGGEILVFHLNDLVRIVEGEVPTLVSHRARPLELGTLVVVIPAYVDERDGAITTIANEMDELGAWVQLGQLGNDLVIDRCLVAESLLFDHLKMVGVNQGDNIDESKPFQCQRPIVQVGRRRRHVRPLIILGHDTDFALDLGRGQLADQRQFMSQVMDGWNMQPGMTPRGFSSSLNQQ